MSDFLLWRDLSEKDRLEIAEHFKHLPPKRLSVPDLEVGAVLVQWMLLPDSIEATEIKPCGNGVEMFLQNKRDNQREYLRFYTSAPPVTLIYDVLKMLKGSDYKKARIYSLTAIGEDQRQLGSQYPPLFEIVDGDRFMSRLVDVQRRVTQASAWQTPATPTSSPDTPRNPEVSLPAARSESQNKIGMRRTSRPPRPSPLILVTSMLVLIMIAVVIYFIATLLTKNTPTPSATNTVTSTHTLAVTDASIITLIPSQTFTPNVALTNSKTLTITNIPTHTASPTLTRTPPRTIAVTATRTPTATPKP